MLASPHGFFTDVNKLAISMQFADKGGVSPSFQEGVGGVAEDKLVEEKKEKKTRKKKEKKPEAEGVKE